MGRAERPPGDQIPDHPGRQPPDATNGNRWIWSQRSRMEKQRRKTTDGNFPFSRPSRARACSISGDVSSGLQRRCLTRHQLCPLLAAPGSTTDPSMQHRHPGILASPLAARSFACGLVVDRRRAVCSNHRRYL
jgi:hypothetical protein